MRRSRDSERQPLLGNANYIHNNAVRHGLAHTWEEWEFSSACTFLREVGREEALRIWKEYPILDYGKGWDEP